MCIYVWISEQTSIISLCSTNLLVFITETEYVYCAVRAESLNIICVKFRLEMSKFVFLLFSQGDKVIYCLGITEFYFKTERRICLLSTALTQISSLPLSLSFFCPNFSYMKRLKTVGYKLYIYK